MQDGCSQSQRSPVPVLGLPFALRHGTRLHFLRVSRRCPPAALSPAVLPEVAEAEILARAGTSCRAAGAVGLEVPGGQGEPTCPECGYQTPQTQLHGGRPVTATTSRPPGALP